MSDNPTHPDHILKAALDGIAAGLFPSLSTDDRRERTLRALGLEPVAQWVDGRMVYVEARR